MCARIQKARLVSIKQHIHSLRIERREGRPAVTITSTRQRKELTMNTSTPKPDPGAKAPPMMHEGDIGSGEITPGQHETNEMIKQIPPLPGSGGSQQDAGETGNQKGGAGKA
jgi:hypothetical protein